MRDGVVGSAGHEVEGKVRSQILFEYNPFDSFVFFVFQLYCVPYKTVVNIPRIVYIDKNDNIY